MVVDDSLIVRTVLSRVIDPEPDLEIVAKLSSAELALAELSRIPVDLVLLDLEMPGMGGLEALPKMLAAHEKLPVLVVSSLTDEGAEHTVSALAMGAADTMPKPRSGQFDQDYRHALLTRIRALVSARRATPHPATRTMRLPVRTKPVVGARPALIAIGASTGGIHAMGQLLRSLPVTVTQPILVVQHLPASFATVFARQLQLASGRPTKVAADGMVVEPGTIYVAGGEAHLVVKQDGDALVLASQTGRVASGCLPSVDPLLESLAANCGPRSLAVILSGMGKDGLLGARSLAASGGRIVAQDQASSAVWGMPRAVAEAGLAEAVLPPEQLAHHIAHVCGLSQ
jgi:two-component system chemotaxis response regulator CheB